MFGQKGCDDHAGTVGHRAGGPEVAHGRVDDRVAGFASLPATQLGRAFFPGKIFERIVKRLFGCVGLAQKNLMGELPPSELPQKSLGRLVVESMVFSDGVPDLVRADFSEVQVGREAGGFFQVDAVATLGIAADRFGSEGLGASVGLGLARRPRLGQAFIPGDFRKQVQLIDRKAFRLGIGPGPSAGQTNRGLRRRKLTRCTPEGREHLVRFT